MAETRPVNWSADALADLAEIWDYYEQAAGLNTAENVIREIGEVASILGSDPFAGRARNEVRSGLRSIVANIHVIFYRVKDGAA
jgi:plasmid stabilization system protein ParE